MIVDINKALQRLIQKTENNHTAIAHLASSVLGLLLFSSHLTFYNISQPVNTFIFLCLAPSTAVGGMLKTRPCPTHIASVPSEPVVWFRQTI